jgi:hypothetical protein
VRTVISNERGVVTYREGDGLEINSNLSGQGITNLTQVIATNIQALGSLYTAVLYVAFAPDTIDPDHINLFDFDVDGELALVADSRILIPAGPHVGIWIVNDNLTSLRPDPLFVVIPGNIVRAVGSVGQPDYIQTSQNYQTPVFDLLYNLIKHAIGVVSPFGTGGWVTIMTINGSESINDVLQITSKAKITWSTSNIEITQGIGQYLCGTPLTNPVGLIPLIFANSPYPEGTPSDHIRVIVSEIGSSVSVQVKQDAIGGNTYTYKLFCQAEVF